MGGFVGWFWCELLFPKSVELSQLIRLDCVLGCNSFCLIRSDSSFKILFALFALFVFDIVYVISPGFNRAVPVAPRHFNGYWRTMMFTLFFFFFFF
jgi:hypothetical protein